MPKENNKVLITEIMRAVGPLDATAIFSPVVIFNNLKGEPVVQVSYEALQEIFNDYLKE